MIETSTKLRETKQKLYENEYLSKEQETTEKNLYGHFGLLMKQNKNNKNKTAEYSAKMVSKYEELSVRNKEFKVENSEQVEGLEIN